MVASRLRIGFLSVCIGPRLFFPLPPGRGSVRENNTTRAASSQSLPLGGGPNHADRVWLTAAERPLDNPPTPTACRGERRGTCWMGPRGGRSPEDTDRARPRRARRRCALGALLLLAALACQPAAAPAARESSRGAPAPAPRAPARRAR